MFPDLTSRLLITLSQHRNGCLLCLDRKYIHGNCSNEFFSFVFRLHEFKRNTKMAARCHNFIAEIAKCNRKSCSNSLFSFLLLALLSASLQTFKCNVCSHLLSVWIQFFYCFFFLVTFSQLHSFYCLSSSINSCKLMALLT